MEAQQETTMQTSFRNLTPEHLGDTATPQDVALFQTACLRLQEQEPLSDAEATARVWNDGDWLPAACQLVGATISESPGADAVCGLCDEPPTEASGPLVATRWGWMHGACYESHDEAVGEEA